MVQCRVLTNWRIFLLLPLYNLSIGRYVICLVHLTLTLLSVSCTSRLSVCWTGAGVVAVADLLGCQMQALTGAAADSSGLDWCGRQLWSIHDTCHVVQGVWRSGVDGTAL